MQLLKAANIMETNEACFTRVTVTLI